MNSWGYLKSDLCGQAQISDQGGQKLSDISRLNGQRIGAALSKYVCVEITPTIMVAEMFILISKETLLTHLKCLKLSYFFLDRRLQTSEWAGETVMMRGPLSDIRLGSIKKLENWEAFSKWPGREGSLMKLWTNTHLASRGAILPFMTDRDINPGLERTNYGFLHNLMVTQRRTLAGWVCTN